MNMAELPRSVWIAIGIPLGLAILAWLGRRPAKVKDGWIELQSTVLLYLLAIFAALISPMFAIFGWLGIFKPMIANFGHHSKLFGSGMLVLAALFPYAAATTFFTRIRFNSEGVEKSWFGRPVFYAWSEVSKLDRSLFLGPRLIVRGGRSIPISQYLRGFHELSFLAQSKGIPVADEFLK